MRDLVFCLSLGIATSLVVGMEDGLDLIDDLAERCGWDARERNRYRGIETCENFGCEDDGFWFQPEEQFVEQDAASVVAEAEVNPEVNEGPEILAAAAADADPPPVTEPTASQQSPDDPPSLGRQMPKPSVSIVLLGWRPAELSLTEPDGLAPLVEHLKTIDEFIGIRMADSVDIWSPKPASVQIAERRIEFDVVDGAVDEVLDSFDSQALSVSYYGRQPAKGAENFADAATRLRSALRGDPQRSRRYEEAVQAALASFESLLDRDVATPLVAAGADSADPVRKANYLLAAELSRLLHRQIAIVDYRTECAAKQITELRDLSPEFKNMKSSLALIDRFISVVNVLTKK